jgi:hypothetical protein
MLVGFWCEFADLPVHHNLSDKKLDSNRSSYSSFRKPALLH